MYFSGRIHSTIFENVGQAFYIVRMVLDSGSKDPADKLSAGGDPVVVVGHVPGLAVETGTWFGFDAEWVTHEKFGRQLSISRAPIFKQQLDPDTVEKILVANGCGGRTVGMIRAHFGDDGFIGALGDAKRLEEVSGLDTFGAMFVAQRWETTQEYFRTLTFLGDLDLPAGRVRQVWAKFGDEAEKLIQDNPWQLVEVDGISFSVADSIAARLGTDMSRPERVAGAVLYVAKDQRSFGHMYMLAGPLFAEVSRYVPEVTKEAVGVALAAHHKAGNLVLDRETKPGITAIYEPWSHKVEKESAALVAQRRTRASFRAKGLSVKEHIARLASVGPATEKEARKKRPVLRVVAETAVEEWGRSAHLVLSDKQKEGVVNALIEPVSILTGLPGTGKTTSLQAVVRILQEGEIPFLLCAPTGIAAKNLAALTGAQAYTIHRAFAAKGISDEKREFTYTGVVGESEGRGGGDADRDVEWGNDEHNPYPAEVVIVDEASMLDQHLIYRLLTCTAPTCRMVIVGDAAQLPSVGPGNVLRDLVRSGEFPVVDLREIFRQKDTSDIVFAAHDIFRGEVPKIEEGSDFSLVQVPTEERALEVILQLASKLYEKRANFQILSPRHMGTVGVTSLNTRIRELLNPRRTGVQEIKVGDDVIREDDRIMVVRNNYKLGVYNGDVGKMARIDKKAKEVVLKIFGTPPLMVHVPFKDIGSLVRLAYACTVHKAQGLEYDCIVMPLVDGFKQQLQRNLLYTAVTRAKKKVVLVGTLSALSSAVANDREDLRNTLFKERIVPPPPAGEGKEKEGGWGLTHPG